MLSFRIKAPDQMRSTPRVRNTESQSYFKSSASDWDVFWALWRWVGAGVVQGCQTDPVEGRGAEATEARALILRASSSLEI